MKHNIGTNDRIIRFSIALIAGILYLGDFVSGPFSIVTLVIGGIMLLTSMIGFCPLYSIVGLKTTKKQ